ncbi:MAG: SGNH/GDSL hydrolase family protein [Victivallales bacterium]|jgi:lysophospholipase L1-like esterase
MVLKKLVAGAASLIFAVGSSAFAQNLLVNGSFEDEAVLSQADDLVKKGFALEFDGKRWAKGWVINGGTKPASISLVEGKDVPDGKRYLNVKTLGQTHIYNQESISGEVACKISFIAKGEPFKDKESAVVIHAYLYKKVGGGWAGKNNILGTFKPENSWKAFSLDLPAVGGDLVVKIAFEFQGSCDLDNVKVERVGGKIEEAKTASPVESGLARQAPQNPVNLLLPPVVYAVPGSEINIYFDNVLLVPDTRDYLFDVDCKNGRQDQGRWRFTPEAKDVGSFPLTIRVFDQNSKMLAEANTTVTVSPADAGKGRDISLMVLGDSLTGASVYPGELYKLFKTGDNPNVRFIGSHIGAGNPPKEGVPCHEGRGGWAWSSYCSKWTENSKEAPYLQKSPFLSLKDGKPVLDFKAYCDKYNGGKAPDYITVFLGINDIFGANDSTIDQTIDKIFESADMLIGEFRRVGVDTKIALALVPPPAASQDAFGENYRCGQTRWQYRKNQNRLVERMLAKFSAREKDKLFVIPVYVNLDCANNYPMKEEPVNARNPKKTSRACNGVHPAAEGYYQIADSFYFWFKNELNSPVP